MKSKMTIILFSILILMTGHLGNVQAVTDAELDALEKQIEQQEAEEKQRAEANAKEAARKRKEARARVEAEAKKKAEEARKQVELELQKQEEELARKAKEERQRAEAEVAKQLEEKRLAEKDAAAKQAENSKAGEFIKIPGGTFDISGKSVTIEPFEMGKYEVTQAQWQEIMGNNPSQLKNCSNCPVSNVSWKDVQTFIKKLNSDVEDKYRLPTTAEWMYACFKGGYQSECKGNNLDAINVVNRGSPRQVIQELANKFGLHGLNSYTWEWTCSEYTSKYSSKWLTCENVGKNFVPAIRGGKISHMDPSAKRYLQGYNSAYLRFQNIGFRLVVSK